MAADKDDLWETMTAHPGFGAGNVLDLRPAAAFRRGHPPGAVNLPLPDNPDRDAVPALLETAVPSIFLPPRHEPLLVLALPGQHPGECAAALAARGREDVLGLAFPDPAAGGVAPGPLATGSGRDMLWRPDPWLLTHQNLLPPPAAGPVLDLGCGSGRSAVWLALRGYRVVGIDRDPEALALGARLAEACAVRCDFREADLRRPEAVPAGPFAAVLDFRYLERDLLAIIPRLLVRGGTALVRTFRDAPGYGGHPHPRHRLAPYELLRAFPRPGFEALAHEESFDPDGRPAAGIVARRTHAPL